ncbi:cAMP-dependent protein kinase inhibitor alpha [Grus japonensis]|uniref:cAMP-dependent protein kinase inhibitor alpha n=1 Tax=Grus japonensis TaxID=30415 RepID=A0ABC9W0C8_GRUJA
MGNTLPQSVLILGIAPTHVQDLAFGLVEPHEVHTGPLLKLVQVPLDGIPSLRHINRTTQFGVAYKLAEGALNPTVYVIGEGIKQYWSRYGPRGTPLITDHHLDIELVTTTFWI